MPSDVYGPQSALLDVLDMRQPQKRPGLPAWDNPRFGGHLPFGEHSSPNHQHIANAVRLFVEPDHAIPWWIDALEHQLGDRHDRPRARGWCGAEPLAGDAYDRIHTGALIGVRAWASRHDHSELLGLSERWLATRWIAGALTSLRVRPINRWIPQSRAIGWMSAFGSTRAWIRSGPAHTERPAYLDSPERCTWLVPWLVAGADRLPGHSEDDWLGDVLRLRPAGTSAEWRKALAEIAGGSQPNRGLLAKMAPIRGGVRIRRTAMGVAVWATSMDGWSGATAPLEATVLHLDRAAQYLASNSGARSGIQMGSCAETDGRRLYVPSGWMAEGGLAEREDGEQAWVSLPDGPVLWEVVWDSDGARLSSDPPGQQPQPPSGPDHDPVPAVELPHDWPHQRLDGWQEDYRLIALACEEAVTGKRDPEMGLLNIRDAAKSAIDGATRALTAATGSQQEAAKEMAWARDKAEELGVEFFALTDGYAKLSFAARDAGIAQSKTRDITEAVATAAKVLNLSMEDQQGVFTALEQIVSKGNLSMEELRRQLGNRLPGAFAIAAKGMGVTTEELERMIRSGEIAAKDFLPRFAEAIQDAYGSQSQAAVKDLAAETTRLGNALKEVQAAIVGANEEKSRWPARRR